MTVTVIIPAFNAVAWIGQAIESARAQSYHDLEVIVVDDGSTDGTADVVRSISDPRLRLVLQDNRGAGAARNRGLLEAQGKWIQFLDADDLLASDKLQAQLDALASKPPGTIASCPWARFSESPQKAVIRPEPVWAVADPVEWLIVALNGGGMMQPGGWLVPRSVIDAAGPWNETLSLHDDGEFFTRVLLKSEANVFVPETRVFYREVGGSLSRRRSLSAIKSAFAVCQSRHQHLLEASDDKRARQALSTQYAQFAYEFARQAPEIAQQAMDAIHNLNSDPSPIIGGKGFRCLTRILGFNRAWQIRNRMTKQL